jgi:hypothetical protein
MQGPLLSALQPDGTEPQGDPGSHSRRRAEVHLCGLRLDQHVEWLQQAYAGRCQKNASRERSSPNSIGECCSSTTRPPAVRMSAICFLPVVSSNITTSRHSAGKIAFHTRCQSVSFSHQRSQCRAGTCAQCHTTRVPHLAIIPAPQAGQLPRNLGSGRVRLPTTLAYCI